jgi:hypothetical protein
MANKRNLKKQVKHICNDIATECLIAAQFVEGADDKAFMDIVSKTAALQGTALENITFSFDKYPRDFENLKAYRKARNDYYKKAFGSFRAKFNTHVNELVKEMNAAVPQSVRDAHKA